MKPEWGRERTQFGFNAREYRGRIFHEIDLVHSRHYMAQAKQRTDIGMTTRLRQYALARIHEQHGGIGIRSASGHVARVLLMAWCIRDNESATRRGKIAIGDIDGDALFAFGFKTIHQQRQIHVGACRAVLAAIALERGELVRGNAGGVVKQAANERRLAIINTAAGEETQKRLAGHQKYPSRFFFSMDAASSVSMRRPALSDSREVRISSMMSSSVAAVLSTAADSG